MLSRLIVVAGAALSISAAAHAKSPPAEFSPGNFRSHVAFLSDDLIEGRESGTRGYEIAARYVASYFDILGLKPAVAGKWYQTVPLVEFRIADGPAAVTIGEKRFSHNGGVVMRPTPFAAAPEVSAPAVFVGYGVVSPEHGIDDYAGVDVKGKIVVMVAGIPKGYPSEVAAHINNLRRANAGRKGAIGLLGIRPPEAEKAVPWERFSKSGTPALMTWVAPDGRPFDDAPGVTIGAALSPEAAAALFEGAPKTLEQAMADLDKGSPASFELKPLVKIERQSATRTLESENVIGLLRGSDPKLADEYIVLMAHLDGRGLDPQQSTDRIRNGALDNAAGIATLLEVARVMAAEKTKPRRSILFVASTAEEKHLLGSQYLARNSVTGPGKVVGVVNLDMPLLLYDFQDVVAFGSEHSTLGRAVQAAAGAMNLALSPDPLPQEGLFARSDHYNFVKEGVPSIALMTGFANGGEKQFRTFLAEHYHKASDDLSLPIDWNAGAKFARLNYLIAREIADAVSAPHWYADSYFGRNVAPTAPKAERQAP